MISRQGFRTRKTRFLNQWHARRVTRMSLAGTFRAPPEPRTIGSFARGRQLIAGNYLFSGHLFEGKDTPIWRVEAPDRAWEDETHGFAWLDDLSAVGDGFARKLAQDWLMGWIESYGRGQGPGWLPHLTGRRVIRWISHGQFVFQGLDADVVDKVLASIAQQAHFLSRRWHAAPPGLPRFEALAGFAYAGLSLEGFDELADAAQIALAQECRTQVDHQGGLPTRNPEELLEVFMLLTWVSAAILENGRGAIADIQSAVERIAPTLRTLRHSDGGLARFHGGGRGLEGWLDHALAQSGVKSRAADGLAMGFARMSAGRTSVIIDASPPPQAEASFNGHASTLAFEVTSGRRALIVNCGSGARFGSDWRRAGRATPSHSALCLDGYSSARLGPANSGNQELLIEAPETVPIEVDQTPEGLRFQGGHDGYLRTHGLTHARTLKLSFNGRELSGEDLLVAIEEADLRRFNSTMQQIKPGGIPFDIRFHLHPEVDATIDMGGTAVSMAMKSGEIWVFRKEGPQHYLALEPSVYLEKGRLKPRATQQIVLSGRALEYATRIRWSLSKAQETAIGVRDLRRDETPTLTTL